MRGTRHVVLYVLVATLAACTVFNGVGVPNDDPVSVPSRTSNDGSSGDPTSPAPVDGTSPDGGMTVDAGALGFAYEPVPAGCVTDVTAGHHVYTCNGLTVDVMIPPMKTAIGSPCAV